MHRYSTDLGLATLVEIGLRRKCSPVTFCSFFQNSLFTDRLTKLASKLSYNILLTLHGLQF